MLTRDHAVLPSTHTVIFEWNEPSCIYSQRQRITTLASAHFLSHRGYEDELPHCLNTVYYLRRCQSRGWGFLPPFVCTPVGFSAQYPENRCSYDHQTWHRNVPQWVLETHLFWDQKVKVTSHKNSAGVGLCTLVSAGFFCLICTKITFISDTCMLNCWFPPVYSSESKCSGCHRQWHTDRKTLLQRNTCPCGRVVSALGRHVQ